MLTLLAALACSTPAPEAPAPSAPAPQAACSPAGHQPTIGGDPILPKVSVIGAIPDADVEAGMKPQLDAIAKCWQDQRATKPDLKGKVLVYFTIDAQGGAHSPRTVATSLRDPATEDCVVAQVANAHFPPLQTGRTAVVNYPFVFPPE